MRLGLVEWLLIGGAGSLLLYEGVIHVDSPLLDKLLGHIDYPMADLKPGCRGKANTALARQVAQKWAPVFGADVENMMIIAKIESGFRADCSNLDPRALVRGGAVGMFQQTVKTAAGHAKALASSTNPQVQATLLKWTLRGRSSLLDPDVCGMFCARQVGQLQQKFGNDLALVAAGYHDGGGKVAAVLATGARPPTGLGSYGQKYVANALAAQAAGVGRLT